MWIDFPRRFRMGPHSSAPCHVPRRQTKIPIAMYLMSYREDCLAKRQFHILLSQTNRHVWWGYITTKRPPPLVWSGHNTIITKKGGCVKLVCADAGKMLYFTAPTICWSLAPLTILCPLPLATWQMSILCNYPAVAAALLLLVLLYVGPTWHHRVANNVLLHALAQEG